MRSRFKHGVGVVVAFTLLFAWLFWRPVSQGRLLADSDLFDQYLPLFLSPSLVWSNYEFGGVPAFADPENSAFYPIRALFAHVFQSWNGFLISAFVLTGSFTYAYVFDRTRSRRAAAVGSLTFVLSEAVLERLPHANVLHAVAWLPLVLLAIDRVRRGRHRAWWAGVGTIAGASCVLAGHPQIAVYAGYLCGAYALTGLIAERASGRDWWITGAIGVGVPAVAAVSLVPLLEISGRTVRQGFGLNEFVDYANTPWQMLSGLFPVITHSGLEAPTYAGLLAPLLAATALARPRGDWRLPFWAAVVVLSVLIGMGTATPVTSLAIHLPGYDRFRIGARHLIFASFAVSVLAGYGMAAIERRRPTTRAVAIVLAVFAATMLGGAVLLALWPDRVRYDHVNEHWPLPWLVDGVWSQLAVALACAIAYFALCRHHLSRPLWLAVIVLLVADLLNGSSYRISGSGLDVITVAPDATRPGEHARALAARLGEQRFISVTGSLRDDVVPGLFSRPWQLASAGGYTSLLLNDVAALTGVTPSGQVEGRALDADDLGLDVLGVKYALVRRDLADDRQSMALESGPRWRLLETFSTPALVNRGGGAGHEYRVYENTRALPRVWMAPEVLPVTDGALADAIHTGRLRNGRVFDPRETALVDEGEMPAEAHGTGGSAQLASQADSRVVVHVSSPAGGFVVLGDVYYPGWRARIDDGDPLSVHRTDMALQGVSVPAGNHVVAFEFASRSRRIGLTITAAAIVVLAGAFLVAARGARVTSVETVGH